MAGFQFKLQSLLKVRQVEEDHRKRELGEIMVRRNAMHEHLRDMQQTIVDAKHALANGLVGSVDVSQIGHFARYSSQVRLRAQAMVSELADVERQITAARERLLTATHARKALELLRDRQLERWQLEQNRKESVLLDEVGMQAFVRSQNRGDVS